MKKIGIVMAGAEGQEIKDVQIKPGTTAREILDAIKLKDGQLSPGANEAMFGANDNVYERVQDGAKLFASTRAEVGHMAA
jgi:hypothetical protein